VTGTPRRGEPSLPQPLSPSLPPTGRERGGQAILLAAAVLLLAGCLLQIVAGYSHPDLSGHAWGSDDAYISYRYAQHLASGQGLVFNPGERVEGFSNLLYVLLLAPAAALVSSENLYAVSAGLNVVFALAALVLLYRFTLRRLGPEPAAAVAMLVALCPAIWVWVASGLETPLVLLLQIAVWVLAEDVVEGRDRRLAGALCLVAALCVLARVDGFITPFLAAGFLILRGRWRAGLAVAATTVATFGATTLWRLSYYGWPLPNTYYAKVTGALPLRLEAGGQQLLSVLLGTGLMVSVAALAVSGVAGLKELKLSFPIVFAAGWLAYFVYVGGDFYSDRFLLALFPMGAWALLALAAESKSRRMVAVLVVLLAVAQLTPIVRDPRYSYTLAKYDRWVTLGHFLGATHRGEVIAIDGAGKVPFFSGLQTIDMLGLADVHIAHGKADPKGYFWAGHAKSDLDYVLARRPDLISNWLAGRWGLEAGPILEPAKLARAGYRLAYLVNADPHSKGQGKDILDVRNLSPDEIRRLRDHGYRTGVFERKR
jgi:arabinofuranosyltransferase